MARDAPPGRILGGCPAESETAAREGVSGFVVAVAPDLASEPQRVAAPNHRHVVDPLKDGRASDKGAVSLLSKAGEAKTEADRRSSPRQRHGRWQPDNSQLRCDVPHARVEALLIVVELRVAK